MDYLTMVLKANDKLNDLNRSGLIDSMDYINLSFQLDYKITALTLIELNLIGLTGEDF